MEQTFCRYGATNRWPVFVNWLVDIDIVFESLFSACSYRFCARSRILNNCDVIYLLKLKHMSVSVFRNRHSCSKLFINYSSRLAVSLAAFSNHDVRSSVVENSVAQKMEEKFYFKLPQTNDLH